MITKNVSVPAYQALTDGCLIVLTNPENCEITTYYVKILSPIFDESELIPDIVRERKSIELKDVKGELPTLTMHILRLVGENSFLHE